MDQLEAAQCTALAFQVDIDRREIATFVDLNAMAREEEQRDIRVLGFGFECVHGLVKVANRNVCPFRDVEVQALKRSGDIVRIVLRSVERSECVIRVADDERDPLRFRLQRPLFRDFGFQLAPGLLFRGFGYLHAPRFFRSFGFLHAPHFFCGFG